MKTIQIADGVHLHMIKTAKFKTTAICILFRRPLDRNNVTMNALIPGVLKNACTKYPTLKEINGALEDMYGAVFDAQVVKKGEEQILQFYMEVLNSRFEEGLAEQALRFLYEIIFRPKTEGAAFDPAIVRMEKENLLSHIEGRLNNKGEYLKLKCLAEMCQEDPFGVYGDGYQEDVADINESTLYARYQEIINASPVEVVVIGNEEETLLVQELGCMFPSARGEILSMDPAKPFQKKDIIQKKEEAIGIAQGKICMGLSTEYGAKGKSFLSLLMFNEILGGGANSRLFEYVREKESLCYNISSFIYRFKGIMMIQCGVDRAHFDRALQLIEEQIHAIAAGDISDSEIDLARAGLIKSFQGMADHPSAVLDFYLSQYLLEDSDGLETFVAHLRQVKKEDIVQAAKATAVDTVYLMY